MTLARSLGAVGVCFGLGSTLARADEPSLPPPLPISDPIPVLVQGQPPRPPVTPAPPRTPGAPPTTTTPARPPVTPPAAPQLQTAPVTDVFSQAPQASASLPANLQPQMLGDLLAGLYARANTPVRQTITTVIPGFTIPGTPGTNRPPQPPRPPIVVPPRVIVTERTVLLPLVLQPVVTRGAFKIAENESPRPVDRVTTSFNYYSNGKIPTAFGNRTFQAYRETVALEKTLLNGDASLGVRLNTIQTSGEIGDDDFGDTTFIAKYALVNDAPAGNVLSGGLAVTAPTGPRTVLFDGSTIRSTLLQPWTGFIYNFDRTYVHGFTALVIPTDDQDVLLSTTDLGIGYRLYQASDPCALLTSVAPTLEAHWTTPLNNRGLDGFNGVGFPDIVVLTGGLHVGLGGRALLTTGVAVPVTGPKPFDLEAIAQLNWRF